MCRGDVEAMVGGVRSSASPLRETHKEWGLFFLSSFVVAGKSIQS
jgi:hypothetical protein